MKLIYASLLAVAFLSAPAFADFSGPYGRNHLPACNPVNGNWVGAFDSCPPLGGGFGAPDARASTVPVPPPKECPPKETEQAV